MQLSYQILDERNWVSWDSFFYVFSISKYKKLLSLAGVPDLIAKKPELVISSTEIYWDCRHSKTRNVTVKNLEEYKLNLQNEKHQLIGAIENFFLLVNKEYGDKATKELFDWTQRNFIDNSLVRKWDMWAALFLKLKKHIENNLILNLIQKETVSKILTQYEYKLQGAESNPVAELMNEAEKIALSNTEKRLISLEINYLTIPSDPQEVDVGTLVEESIQRQAAYEIVDALRKSVCVADQQVILTWGKSWAILHYMSDADTFPSWSVQ